MRQSYPHHRTMRGAKPVFTDLCPTFMTHFGSYMLETLNVPNFWGTSGGTSGDREAAILNAGPNSCNTSTYNMHTCNKNTSTHKQHTPNKFNMYPTHILSITS